MRGEGLRGVCLLADHEWELRHPMLEKLLKRSASFIQPEQLCYATASEAGLERELERRKIKVLVPLGERALRQTLGEVDILRWRGRVKESKLLPRVWVVPTFAPSKLQSHRGEEDGEIMRHPPRFHGVFMMDLYKALQIAEHGFARQQVSYLCDPQA